MNLDFDKCFLVGCCNSLGQKRADSIFCCPDHKSAHDYEIKRLAMTNPEMYTEIRWLARIRPRRWYNISLGVNKIELEPLLTRDFDPRMYTDARNISSLKKMMFFYGRYGIAYYKDNMIIIDKLSADGDQLIQNRDFIGRPIAHKMSH